MKENMDTSLLDSESVFIKIYNESPSRSPNYTDSIEELQDDLRSLSWDQLITLDLEESSQITPTNGNMYEKVKLTKHEAFKLLNMAATLLQRNIRRYFQQKKYRNFLIAYRAAVKIQSAWRGYRTRNLDNKVAWIKHNYMIGKLQEQVSTMNENYKNKLHAANKDKSILIQIVSILSKELDKIKDQLGNLDCVEHDIVSSSKPERNIGSTTPTKNQSDFHVNNPHLNKSDSGINVNMNSSCNRCNKEDESNNLNDKYNSLIAKDFESSSSLIHHKDNTVIQAEAVVCTTPTNISINKEQSVDSIVSSSITNVHDVDNIIKDVACTEPKVSFLHQDVVNAFSSARIAIYDDMSLSGRNTSSPIIVPTRSGRNMCSPIVPTRSLREKEVLTTSESGVEKDVTTSDCVVEKDVVTTSDGVVEKDVLVTASDCVSEKDVTTSDCVIEKNVLVTTSDCVSEKDVTTSDRVAEKDVVVTTPDRAVHSPIRCTTPTNIFINECKTNLCLNNIQTTKLVNESKTSNSVSSSIAVEEYIENLLDHVIQNQTNPTKTLKLEEISHEMNGHMGHISNHISCNDSLTSLSEGNNEFSNMSLSLPRKEDAYNPFSVQTPIQCKTPTNMSLNNTLVSSSVVDEDESNHFNLIGGIVTVNDIMLYEEAGKTGNVNNGHNEISQPGTLGDEFMQADSVEFMNDSLQDCHDNVEEVSYDSLQMDSFTLNPMEADSLQFMHDSLQVD